MFCRARGLNGAGFTESKDPDGQNTAVGSNDATSGVGITAGHQLDSFIFLQSVFGHSVRQDIGHNPVSSSCSMSA